MNVRKASLVRLAASYPKGSEARRALLVLAAKDLSAVVEEVTSTTVTLKGDGNAALKAGVTAPKAWVPGKPKVGDDYFATFTPGNKEKPWTFAVMDFSLKVVAMVGIAPTSPAFQTGAKTTSATQP